MPPWRRHHRFGWTFRANIPEETVGTMLLDFVSPTEVTVKDEIPNATPEGPCLPGGPYPVSFAFLFAAQVLAGIPQVGQDVVRRASSVLSSVVDPDNPLAYNGTMLGVCCEGPLAIVSGKGRGKWVYSAELFSIIVMLHVTISVRLGTLHVTMSVPGTMRGPRAKPRPRGDEHHFHLAALDTVLEVVRRRLGEKGGAIPAGALRFFAKLDERGCDDVLLNEVFARDAAAYSASAAGWQPDG